MKSPRSARRRSAPRSGPDQGAGFFGPSDAAKATFAELDQRWSTLFAWGLKAKVPEAHGQWESWGAFRASWLRGDPDLTALSAQTAELNIAESSARDHGYGGDKPPVTAPDAVNTSDALHTADQVDHGAKVAGEVVEQAAAAAQKQVVSTAQMAPWWLWFGLAALGVGVAYAVKPQITVKQHV